MTTTSTPTQSTTNLGTANSDAQVVQSPLSEGLASNFQQAFEQANPQIIQQFTPNQLLVFRNNLKQELESSLTGLDPSKLDEANFTQLATRAMEAKILQLNVEGKLIPPQPSDLSNLGAGSLQNPASPMQSSTLAPQVASSATVAEHAPVQAPHSTPTTPHVAPIPVPPELNAAQKEQADALREQLLTGSQRQSEDDLKKALELGVLKAVEVPSPVAQIKGQPATVTMLKIEGIEPAPEKDTFYSKEGIRLTPLTNAGDNSPQSNAKKTADAMPEPEKAVIVGALVSGQPVSPLLRAITGQDPVASGVPLDVHDPSKPAPITQPMRM